MRLTDSYSSVFPDDVLDRFAFHEVRNASAVLQAAHPDDLSSIIEVLRGWALTDSDIVLAGGNKSTIAADLDRAFRIDGWREARVDTQLKLRLVLQPYRDAGEDRPRVEETTSDSKGYKVDNMRGGVALDVEWNAKDGNLDRDLSAYRVLYSEALIDVAVIITRLHDDLRDFARERARFHGLRDEEVARILGTTTTTNERKLRPRLVRGDGGGCPVLAIYIAPESWVDAPLSRAAEAVVRGEMDEVDRLIEAEGRALDKP